MTNAEQPHPLAPEPGRFLPSVAVASLLEQPLELLKRHRDWCGYPPAQARLDTAMARVREAIAMLSQDGHAALKSPVVDWMGGEP